MVFLSHFSRLSSAAGLAQSAEPLTAEREVAASIPGTGPILRVLKMTENWRYCLNGQTRRTRHFAQSPKRVRIARREERKNYLLLPSRVFRSFLASRKMPRSPRWAPIKRLLCRVACLLFPNTYCRASVHIYNGDFGAISVREQSFTAPVLQSGSSNIGLFFAASLRRNRTANVAEVTVSGSK